MSIQISAACKQIDITGAKRAVLLEFADHANDDGICWPSRSRVMYNTGLSESAVKQQMRELRGDEILTIVDHHDGGRGRVPIYKVCPEKGSQKAPFKEWYEDLKGSNPDPQRGQILPERGHSVPPEPSENHQLEPSSTKEEASNESPSLGGAPKTSSLPKQDLPAKTLTTLTVDRVKEVGFDPAAHQKQNWGKGWSSYVYVTEGDAPPTPEQQFAVLGEIVAAAAGKGGKSRYFLAVEDAVKRVSNVTPLRKPKRDERQIDLAANSEEANQRRTEGYEHLFA